MHPSNAAAPTEPAASPRRPRVIAAIPARYGSSRLPAKPLLELAGRPLIEHVYRRTAAADGLDRTVVLTDDQRIADAVAGFGGEVEMTPAECASGTDRIATAARGWDAEAVINVQGDWILEPHLISRLARHMGEHPDDPMATLAVPAARDELDEPAVVKVVCDRRGRALYFSRAAIPYVRHDAGVAPLKHWGIYGYRRDTLLALADLEPTPLERTESLEQLRALEHGVAIRVLVVEGEALSIDTPEDADRVAAILRQRTAG